MFGVVGVLCVCCVVCAVVLVECRTLLSLLSLRVAVVEVASDGWLWCRRLEVGFLIRGFGSFWEEVGGEETMEKVKKREKNNGVLAFGGEMENNLESRAQARLSWTRGAGQRQVVGQSCSCRTMADGQKRESHPNKCKTYVRPYGRDSRERSLR